MVRGGWSAVGVRNIGPLTTYSMTSLPRFGRLYTSTTAATSARPTVNAFCTRTSSVPTKVNADPPLAYERIAVGPCVSAGATTRRVNGWPSA